MSERARRLGLYETAAHRTCESLGQYPETVMSFELAPLFPAKHRRPVDEQDALYLGLERLSVCATKAQAIPKTRG